MSTNINNTLLQQFVLKKVGDTMTANEARDIGVQDNYNKYAEEKDEVEISMDEILDDDDLYADFATLYVQELEENNAEDEEKKKEEQAKVGQKGEAKA